MAPGGALRGASSSGCPSLRGDPLGCTLPNPLRRVPNGGAAAVEGPQLPGDLAPWPIFCVIHLGQNRKGNFHG